MIAIFQLFTDVFIWSVPLPGKSYKNVLLPKVINMKYNRRFKRPLI